MSLTLYFHPLASFCHKPLIALYERGIAFEPVIVDLGDEASRAAFKKVWPLGKFPVLRDEARNHTVAESSVIVEYLDAHFPGEPHLLPADADRAWRTRMWDRFFDFYIQEPMQKIVTDRLRPEGGSDPVGVEQARTQLAEACAMIERELGTNRWMLGEDFTLADCAAAPALFYADTVAPFVKSQTALAAYLDRLMTRPSFARVLREAQPFFHLFPMERKPDISRLGPVASS